MSTYVFVPVFLFATPIEGAEPYGWEMKLPILECQLLKERPISTDINAPIPFYKKYGNGIPSICMEIESVNDPKTLKTSKKVSVVAQKVSSIGYFPVIYGVKRFFDTPDYSEKDIERLTGEMKSGFFGEYLHCYLGTDMDELLRVEGYDYFIYKNNIPGEEMVSWDRINKSCAIWSKGHLAGYKDATFDIAHYDDEL